ncbi:MAG: fructose 1,6-bisphosphatase [Candidatus Aenigmarchaeota archaeon]|nr:fructose 1,6-bisphosphatase [Candidatus Aenigmarchaeota archaeon]
MKTTISVIKADVGSYSGHTKVHPDLLKEAERSLSEAKGKVLTDFHVTACGDDIVLIMSHTKGVNNNDIHKLAFDTFMKATEIAKSLKLYGAGQDMLKTAFSGNIKGMGPGVAEMEFEERKAEPIIVFAADKTSPGAWNLPLYKMFADPFTTAGLVIEPIIHSGFTFEVHDVIENKKINFSCPAEIYDLLAFIGSHGRFVIKHVFRNPDMEIAAASSTDKLSLIAGEYVGKDDPVLIVRTQRGFPGQGEALEPFAYPHLVHGWNRGSHVGPLMPCSLSQAHPTRFDGPPRIVALGFQVGNGHLVGPVDLFDDPAFDNSRKTANKVADYMRRHGPFEPHRLPENEMEYTSLPGIMERVKGRWEKIS